MGVVDIKRESAIKAIAASLGFFVLYAVVSNLVSLCIQLFYCIADREWRLANEEGFAQQVRAAMEANGMLIGLVQLVLFFIVVAILLKAKGESPFTRIRWNPVPGRTYLLVAVFSISGIVAMNFLFDLLMPPSWAQGAADYSAAYTSGGFVLNLLLVLLVGPFGEEVLMRGLMMGRLFGRLPLWFAVALPTVLFGAGHAAGGMGQVIGTTITGLVFGLTFLWTNSLRTAVLAHGLNNLFAAFLPWDTIMTAASTPLKGVAAILGVGIAVFAAYRIYQGWDPKAAML